MSSRRIDLISHVAFIALCTVLGTVAILNYRHAVNGSGPDAEVLSPRTPVDGLEEIRPQEADLTVFVAVSADCRFCTMSMPFYARMTETALRSRRRVKVVIAADAPVESTKLYIEQYRVHATAIIKLPSKAHLKGTPTLLVISRGGGVVAGWFGRLSSDQEAGLLKLLS